MNSDFDSKFLEDATETLRAIAHPIRIAIIDLLYNNGQMTVSNIYKKLQIQQATASHHLRILKHKNILLVQREGKNVIYSLANMEYYDIIKTLGKVV